MLSPLLQRQLRRARLRLFVRTLLEACLWCWPPALLLTAGWFFLEPRLFSSAPDALRWLVAGSLFGLATVAVAALVVKRTPSQLTVALTMDEKFHLHERVTSSLLLDKRTSSTPAGQALLEDVNNRIGKLDLGSGFPIATGPTWLLSLKSLLIPLAVTILMIAVFTYPPQSQADAGSSEAIKESATQKPTDLQKQAQDVRKQQEEKKAQAQAVKPQSIKESDDEISKLLAKPIQDKDQLKDANNKLDGMENELKQKEKDLAAKNEAIQQQLRKFDQTSRKDPPQEGPAKDMQKALGEGDVKKAGEQAEDIAKKLKDGKLDEQAKKDLNKQIEDVEKKLSELKRQKDEDLKKEKDNIDKQLDRGDIDKKTAEQMKNDLDKKAENTKDLDQLADKMKQCQQCMKDGEGKDGKEGEAKSKEAGEKLQDAADQLKKMAGQQKEQQDLKDQIDDVKQIKQSLQPSQHGGKPVPGAGQRPEDKTGSTKSMDSKVTTPVAKDGRKAISDFVPGPAFKKKSTQDIAGEVVQASQEADAVREHQKVDRSAKDIYKGYFENLRKDLDRDPSPPKP